MEMLLPDDFRDFLKLLNSKKADYLLIGGYAVGCHGYPRATGDMDVWVARNPSNAAKLIEALTEFGFGVEALTEHLFLLPDQIVRMGTPPMRIELLTSISGVSFDDCYLRRKLVVLDGVPVPLISLSDLRANKEAAARPKDLDDLQHLPEREA
jgi:hypothetical protein